MSIESQGCSNNKNIILIDGKWSDESKVEPTNFNFIIQKANNKLGNCLYNNKNQIQCQVDGYGDISFNEKLFKNGVNVFKIEKSDISINIKNCNISSFLSLNKIFILFGVLIFL